MHTIKTAGAFISPILGYKDLSVIEFRYVGGLYGVSVIVGVEVVKDCVFVVRLIRFLLLFKKMQRNSFMYLRENVFIHTSYLALLVPCDKISSSFL